MRRLIGRGWAGASAFFLLCVVAHSALSQNMRIDALSLQTGSRARILGPTADARYELITVASARPDSLRYSPDRSLATKSLAWQQIGKMDASMGRHTNVWRGAGIGFLVGLLGGAAFGAATASGKDGYNAGPMAVLVGLPMGALGGFAGAVLGFAWRSENWMPVTLPRTPVASNRRSINDSHP
jgi:hypothetical protein